MLLCNRTPGCRKLGGHMSPCAAPMTQKRPMTAPDVRTAARAEALNNQYSHKQVPDRYDADLLIAGFLDGAVWGAALVAPTREQIARVIALTDDYDGCFERIDDWEALEQWERDAHPDEEPISEREDAKFWLRRAESVLVLMRGLGEVGS